MRNYEYMVIYHHRSDQHFGVGRVFVNRPSPIQSRDDINKLDAEVRGLNKDFETVFVTSFQLLREYDT